MPDDAVSAVAELATSQHGAITRSQAAATGFHRRRVAFAIRTGWLDEPAPGVLRVTAHAPTWHQRVRIATFAGV